MSTWLPRRPVGWRTALLVCGAFACGGCANAGAPPGGPPDTTVPRIVSITPTSMATGVKPKAVEIRFDEVISEAPRSGGQDLASLVFVSPSEKDLRVDWRRDRLTIAPKKGWRPNTVYSVQIGAGIQDLSNNVIDTATTIVFSTGGVIPNTMIGGVAFDWVAGKGAGKALVQAIAKDSTTYQVVADSAGRFALRHVPAGAYLIRTIVDRNNNRLLDPTEAFDTLRVSLVDRMDLELYAFPHDTVGLRIASIDFPAEDSLKVLKVTFDKPLAPGQLLTPPQVVLKRADSTVVNAVMVQTALERARADSLRRKAIEDSIAAKNKSKPDTSASARARADSVARKARADSVAAAEKAARTAREARLQAQRRGGKPLPPPDTVPLPKMQRPTVSPEVYVTLESRLTPATAYRVQIAGVRSLSGTVKSPSRQFATPRPAAKKDSVAVKRPPL